MPPMAVSPVIVDCGSNWRVDHARGPATFYVKRVYPTRSDVQAILDAAAAGPAVIIWPSAGKTYPPAYDGGGNNASSPLPKI
jgi:hypothetical protein